MMNKKIDYDRVLDYLEHKDSVIPGQIDNLIRELIEETKNLARIKTCYLTTKKQELFSDIPAEEIILFAVTLGVAVDQRVLFYEKVDITRAIIVDAAANVLMEEVISQLETKFRLLYKEKGLYTTDVICPGNPGMPLCANRQIADILDAQKRIGLHVTQHFSLLPQKSVTGVIGITQKNCGQRNYKCEGCKLNCKYRRKSET